MEKFITLTKRTQAPRSAIRAIFDKIKMIDQKRKALGLEPIINLSIGQPHLPPNPVVMEKVLRELASGNVSYDYSPSKGREETLSAIVNLYTHYYPNIFFTKEKVMATIGGSQALWNAFSILIEENDVVVTFEPFFSTYQGQIKALGGELQLISTLKNAFRPDPKALDQMLESNKRVKMVILNYPNNPTGVALTADEAKELAHVLQKHPQVAIVIDDVYRDLNYKEHYTILNFAPELAERSIIINSGAKGLVGAPDLRVGMASANPEWIIAMSQQQLFATSGVPYLTQAALRHAIETYLENPVNQWQTEVKHAYQHNINTAIQELAKYGLYSPSQPDGAFYLFINAKHLIGKEVPSAFQSEIGSDTLRHDIDIVNYFIYAASVATVPGSGFGVDPNEGFIRISCAQNPDSLLTAMKKLGEAVEMLMRPSSESVKQHGEETEERGVQVQNILPNSAELYVGLGLLSPRLTRQVHPAEPELLGKQFSSNADLQREAASLSASQQSIL